MYHEKKNINNKNLLVIYGSNSSHFTLETQHLYLLLRFFIVKVLNLSVELIEEEAQHESQTYSIVLVFYFPVIDICTLKLSY
jgi:hypothetical protein